MVSGLLTIPHLTHHRWILHPIHWVQFRHEITQTGRRIPKLGIQPIYLLQIVTICPISFQKMLLGFLQCALTCLCPKRHQFQCILTLLLLQCKIHPRWPLRALRPPQNCLQHILVQVPSILAISTSSYRQLRHYLTISGQSSAHFQSHAHYMVSTWWPLIKTRHFARNQTRISMTQTLSETLRSRFGHLWYFLTFSFAFWAISLDFLHFLHSFDFRILFKFYTLSRHIFSCSDAFLVT